MLHHGDIWLHRGISILGNKNIISGTESYYSWQNPDLHHSTKLNLKIVYIFTYHTGVGVRIVANANTFSIIRVF